MTAIALYVSLAILAGLAVMQTLLIVGAPIGHYAWGGKHPILAVRQRFAAGVAIILYAGFAAVLLSRGGISKFSDTALAGRKFRTSARR